MEEKKSLEDIIRRLMTDYSFSEGDITRLEENFNAIYKISKGQKLDDTLSKIKKDLIDFRRRNFIKNFFSSIEAIIRCMKDILLDEKRIIKSSEIIKLQGFKFVGPNKKKLKKIPYKIKLEDNVKLTLKKFDEIILNKKSENTFSSPEWEDFKKTIEIRNRITHPKSGNDLKVSQRELDLARKCFSWFINSVLIKRISKATKTRKKGS